LLGQSPCSQRTLSQNGKGILGVGVHFFFEGNGVGVHIIIG